MPSHPIELSLRPELSFTTYYDCEQDGTVTFYEGESAAAGNLGAWISMVYDFTAVEEDVVVNLTIDTGDAVR
ncbi:MAG: hypothetical protein KGQ93_02855 [Cyanobacteria bacterium REEB459]|nr:hypothetical protein [Cyanobacteria bacterium REEB459]